MYRVVNPYWRWPRLIIHVTVYLPADADADTDADADALADAGAGAEVCRCRCQSLFTYLLHDEYVASHHSLISNWYIIW